MKHSKKVFLMVALSATVMGYAKDPSYYINNNKVGTTVLTLKHVKQGNDLSIKSDNGITLYKESIKENGLYQRGFDLTSLPDGSYFFELNKDLEVRTIPFKVTSNIVVFDNDKAEVIFKPYVWAEGNKLFVSKLALNKEPLNVDIYFENGNSTILISSEELDGSQTLERAYELDKKQKGHYKMVLTSEGHTYVENFNIK